MEFNNYCLIVLGNISNVEKTLVTITEEEMKFVSGKGFFMARFMSILSPEEIKNCFIGEKSSAIVFKLSSECSSIELSDKKKQEYLFKEIIKEDIPNQLTENYGSMIDIDKKEIKSIELENKKIMVENMDKSSRKEIMDEIIDKGIDNLTEDDKIILELLIKKKDKN